MITRMSSFPIMGGGANVRGHVYTRITEICFSDICLWENGLRNISMKDMSEMYLNDGH